jgi:hypothetical protein
VSFPRKKNIFYKQFQKRGVLRLSRDYWNDPDGKWKEWKPDHYDHEDESKDHSDCGCRGDGHCSKCCKIENCKECTDGKLPLLKNIEWN